MVNIGFPSKGVAFAKAVVTGAPLPDGTTPLDSQEEKGIFVVSLGHSPSGDTGAQNTSAPSTNGKKGEAFANESEVIATVATDLIGRASKSNPYVAVISWIAKPLLNKLISKAIRLFKGGRSFDCLVQIHCDMVKKYAINNLAGDIIIYYGSNRGMRVSEALRSAILGQKCDLIRNVHIIHHTKSWRGRLGFIADSNDTALILEYDSVARNKKQMASIASTLNNALLSVGPELKNITY